MKEISYARPSSLQEAVALLNEPGVRSRVLAGGTDLINQYRGGRVTCDRVVDVAHAPELGGIQVSERITIGAAVTHTEIVENPGLQQYASLLVQACRQIGSPQIRNAATIGGNVVNAAACADTLPALVCLDAEAVIATAGGEQRMPVAELVTGVNRTALPAGALVRAFVFDRQPAQARVAYLRLGRRQAMSIARLSLAAMAVQDQDGIISQIRLAPGAVFPRVRRVTPVEALLLGKKFAPDLVEEATRMMIEQFTAESGGRWSAAYKERALAALTKRALNEVLVG